MIEYNNNFGKNTYAEMVNANSRTESKETAHTHLPLVHSPYLIKPAHAKYGIHSSLSERQLQHRKLPNQRKKDSKNN